MLNRTRLSELLSYDSESHLGEGIVKFTFKYYKPEPDVNEPTSYEIWNVKKPEPRHDRIIK